MTAEMFTDINGVSNLADAFHDAMRVWSISGDPTDSEEAFRAAWNSPIVSDLIASMTDEEIGTIGYAARTSSFAKDVRGFVYGYKLDDTTKMLSNRQLHEGWALAAVAYLILKGAL